MAGDDPHRLVLTYSVVIALLLQGATDWQDEAAVFMLVGATFFCAAYVQSFRGHIGIEAWPACCRRGSTASA
jgi:TRAP-type C4-dicarboxylate transport system permease small subunit